VRIPYQKYLRPVGLIPGSRSDLAASVLRGILENPVYADRASSVRNRVRAEDGAGIACLAIEQFLREIQGYAGLPIPLTAYGKYHSSLTMPTPVRNETLGVGAHLRARVGSVTLEIERSKPISAGRASKA
jgi:hypothetical protein